MSKGSFVRGFLGLIGLLVLLVPVRCLSLGAVETTMAEARWNARKPVVVDGKINGWEAAPEFLRWRKADATTDGFDGEVLTVNLTGPFADGAWSQHAGALFRLPREVPAGQPFTIGFKARSLTGSKNLTVLRSWGGSKPWNSIGITSQWATYRVTLTPQSPTDSVTFSLVPKAARLQPYCAGSFELGEVQVEPSPTTAEQPGAGR